MDQAKQVELLKESLSHTKGKEPYMSSEEKLIPVSKYTEEAVLEKEKECLFFNEMNVIGFSNEISSPGDFITRDVMGAPVLITRDKDGTAKAFLNVCRHRGATIERKPKGNCKRFVCPYHAWTYRTDGSLASVRHKQGFPTLDLENTSLKQLPCEEAAGLLWVCPNPEKLGMSLTTETLQIAAELEALGCDDSIPFAQSTQIWNANWKLIVDGGLESYHFRVAHSDTIGSFFGDNTSTFEVVGEHIRSVLPRLSLLDLEEKDTSEWNIRDHTHLLYSLYPNASILVQERHFELILMTPLAVDQTRIDLITAARRPESGELSQKAQDYLNANHAFTKKTLDEDFVLAEEIQAGMHTGANDFFRLARFEGALTQWHELIDAKLEQA